MSVKYQSLYVNISEKRHLRSSTKGRKGRFVSKAIGTIVVVFLLAGALGKVYFDRQTKKMVREWQKVYEQLSILKKETENLKMERERHTSGNYILREAEKLELRPSEPGQVRTMNGPAVSNVKSAQTDQNSLIASR